MNTLTPIFKLLSDESRLRMMVLLFQQDLCVCELSGILDLPQPRVSKNLSKLRDLDLVIDERREKFIFYKLKKDNPLLSLIFEHISTHLDQYPQITIDFKRLESKESFLTQCGITYEK